MMIQNERTTALSRRQALNLATASLLVVAGCATFRKDSKLDAAQGDLQRLLDGMAENHGEHVRLASVARRIEIRSRELVAEQVEFLVSFDSLLSERDVTDAQLSHSVDTYSDRRKWLRNDLFRLQDELHAALTAEEWIDVVEVLNRSGRAVAKKSISEA